jgi:SAM-dependent methyltransferase
MRAEDFEYLYNLEETYWWFRSMRRITDTIVGSDLREGAFKVLDAGCGTGYNLGHYRKAGHKVYGLDIAPEAVTGARKRGFHEICQASVTEIPYSTDTFDVVFSFDVICQIPVELHSKAIAEMARVLKPGGLLFVRVPAFEWLRSSHDEDLHTAHRFSLGELRKALLASGLVMKFSTYANCFLFPAVLARRLLKRVGIGAGIDVKPLPAGLGWVDPVFGSVLACETAFFRSNFSLPFGLSAVCYAQKPGQASKLE